MAGLGQPRTGGRAKGVPNKSTRALIDRMSELRADGLECCPVQVLMEFACGKKLNGEPIDVEPSVRVKAASELMSYIHARRKAVEVTGAEGTAITFAVVADDSSITAAEGDRVIAAVADEI